MDFTFHRETKLTKQLKSIQKITVRPKEKGGGVAPSPLNTPLCLSIAVSRGNNCTMSLTLYRNSSDECRQLATVRDSILITTPEGRTIDNTR